MKKKNHFNMTGKKVCVALGLKKILLVSDFRPTLSKHVRPKFI